MKLGELVVQLGCTLEGDAQCEIHGVAGISEARTGEVTFLSNPRYAHELATTKASAVLVDNKAVIARDSSQPKLSAMRSGNPYLDFARTIELFHASPSLRFYPKLECRSANVNIKADQNQNIGSRHTVA